MSASAKWDPQAAAARGAVYLDAVKPDWFRVVNLGTLDLGHTDQCILGQCFDGYLEALATLVPAHNGHDPSYDGGYANRQDFAEAFGFQVPFAFQMRGGYERLGLAWQALILARRKRRTRKKV